MRYLVQFRRKLRYVLERLSSRPRVAGMHVSDSSIYFATSVPDERAQSFRLPPGVVREGRVLDRARFAELLEQFRALVGAADDARPIPVVVTLPAGLVYTQSFTVPNTGVAAIAETAELNLRMLSPLSDEQAYHGWHLIRELPDHLELLGAVADKAAVDEIRTALNAAGFYPIAIEFPGLSIARLLRTVYRNSMNPTIVVQLSSDGINLCIIWNGSLYFDYFRSWHSIQGEEREISRKRLDEVVIEEVRKVVNFCLSRFEEAPREAFLVAPGFEAELTAVLTEQLSLRATPVEVPTRSFAPPWYPAFGASLRGEIDRSRDHEISLAPVSSSDLFFDEQLIDFIRLWRGIAVAVLALFLVFFASASSLLATQTRSLEGQLALFNNRSQATQLAGLRGVAERFNSLVRTIGTVRTQVNPVPYATDVVTNVTDANNVSLLSFQFSGFGASASLTGRAPNYDAVIAFKQAMESAPGVREVTLPLSQLVPADDGSVQFQLSFTLAAPAR